MLCRVHELAGLWPLRLAPFFPISVSCPYLLWRGGPYQVCAMLRPRFHPEQSLDPVQLSPVSAPTCPDQGNENPTQPSFLSPDLLSTTQWELCRGRECFEIHPVPTAVCRLLHRLDAGLVRGIVL